MEKSNLDADGNVQISSDDAKNGCIHKLQINDDAPINLVIPPGTKHEQVMRLKAKGNFQPQTGRRGDLYITVYVDGQPRTSTVKVNNYAKGTVDIIKELRKQRIIPMIIGAFLAVNGIYFGLKAVQDNNSWKNYTLTEPNTNNENDPEQNTNNNSNIVKVLDRVICQDYIEYAVCPGFVSRKIWQSCLDKGYTTSTPSKEVISARDLKELTHAGDSDTNGYCIGSEYIIR